MLGSLGEVEGRDSRERSIEGVGYFHDGIAKPCCK